MEFLVQDLGHEVFELVGHFALARKAEEMSLSSGSRLLREGCSQKKLGAQAGSCKERHRKSENRIRWRCEVKSEEKIMCRARSVPARKQTVGGPAEAARRAVHDARLMCEAAQNIDVRARNDLLLLSRYVSFSFKQSNPLICV